MPTASAAAAAAAFAWQQPQQPAAPDGFVSSVCHRRVLTAHFRRACQIAATFSCFTRQIPQRKTQRERKRKEGGRESIHSSETQAHCFAGKLCKCQQLQFYEFRCCMKKLWGNNNNNKSRAAEQLPHGAMRCHLDANFCNFFVHSEFVSLA